MNSDAKKASAPAGVLVVDKPVGVTSHDVVNRVRRVFGLRRVGHAGTLDPLASGVLVVMVGQATKLAPYLTLAEKSYQATVSLGLATTTLDAEGEPTAQLPLPDWINHPRPAKQRINAALACERSRRKQQPPVFSAIKVGGKAAYARVRAGQDVQLEPRAVEVFELELQTLRAPVGTATTTHGDATRLDCAQIELSLRVSKGYYVRALARDLGQRLGLPAHLSGLRRTASGPFDISEALVTAEVSELRQRLVPLAAAARRVLPEAVLTDGGVQRAGWGQPLGQDDFASSPPPATPSAWFTRAGRLVAVGRLKEDGQAEVLRGFPPTG